MFWLASKHMQCLPTRYDQPWCSRKWSKILVMPSHAIPVSIHRWGSLRQRVRNAIAMWCRSNLLRGAKRTGCLRLTIVLWQATIDATEWFPLFVDRNFGIYFIGLRKHKCLSQKIRYCFCLELIAIGVWSILLLLFYQLTIWLVKQRSLVI